MNIFGVEVGILPLIEVIAGVVIIFYFAGWAWTKGKEKADK